MHRGLLLALFTALNLSFNPAGATNSTTTAIPTCGEGQDMLCETAKTCITDKDCFSGSCTDSQCDATEASIQLAQTLDGSMKMSFTIPEITGPPSWVGLLGTRPALKNWNVVKATYGYPADMAFTADPDGTGSPVLRIDYKKDSYNPNGSIIGGIGISANPVNMTLSSNVTLEYEVYFPPGFDFVKGGKLPGLYGGHRSCTGGNPAYDCFSTRFMWREQGLGEAYLYVHQPAQVKQLCRPPYLVPQTFCNPSYGISVDRGGFMFNTGQWNRMRQEVQLNTFTAGNRPNPDGSISVWHDGNFVFHLPQIVLRIKPKVHLLGIDLETFFGGATPDYATPTDQSTYFRGFKLWN